MAYCVLVVLIINLQSYGAIKHLGPFSRHSLPNKVQTNLSSKPLVIKDQLFEESIIQSPSFQRPKSPRG